tara:strand:+ start:539 stop:829 length:291 start_codon:yes stop_codon:yes gene_type:complete
MNIKKEIKEQLHRDAKILLAAKKYEKARELIGDNMLKGYQICQQTLKEQYYYGAREERKFNLNFSTMTNPHYKCAADMKLFLIAEADDKLVKRVAT